MVRSPPHTLRTHTHAHTHMAPIHKPPPRHTATHTETSHAPSTACRLLHRPSYGLPCTTRHCSMQDYAAVQAVHASQQQTEFEEQAKLVGDGMQHSYNLRPR